MTLKHFIERPVLASVISIVIVIAGIIGLATLPVEVSMTPLIDSTRPGRS